MKKITSLLMVISALFIFKTASSQIVFTENFNYTAGDSIGAHGWTGFSSFVNTIMVSSPGLSFPGYINSNIGNSSRMKPTGQDAYKDASTSDSIGSFYLSFMVRVDTARSGDYFIALLPGTSTTFYNCRVHVRTNGAGLYSFGLGKGNTTDVIYNDAATFATGATVMVVAKYTFVTGAQNDILSLYAFTTSLPSTEPVTPTVGPYPGVLSSDIGSVGRVALRQGTASSAPSLLIDGIQVSKLWPKIITGVSTISTIADDFSLSQNYPNPFNPSTKINFSLPVNGNVILKVYNALGKEVSNLVNGRMNSGSYTVDFNGSNLNSGVYFYKLEVSGANGSVYSDMKKLMLVK